MRMKLQREISDLEYRLERAVNWEPDAHRRELERENQRLRDALAEIDHWLAERRPTAGVLRQIVAKAVAPESGSTATHPSSLGSESENPMAEQAYRIHLCNGPEGQQCAHRLNQRDRAEAAEAEVGRLRHQIGAGPDEELPDAPDQGWCNYAADVEHLHRLAEDECDRLKAIGRRLHAAYVIEEDTNGFPFSFELREAHHELAAVVDVEKKENTDVADPRQSFYIAGYEKAEAKAAGRIAELEAALRLFATGPRPDGTYNLCREAVEQRAKEVLAKGDSATNAKGSTDA